jgi:hypothetical protein
VGELLSLTALRPIMSKIDPEKKKLAQLSDKELDDYIASDRPYLLNAIRERTYRTDRKLIKLSRRLLNYTIALFVLTLALLAVEIRGIFFQKVANNGKITGQMQQPSNITNR